MEPMHVDTGQLRFVIRLADAETDGAQLHGLIDVGDVDDNPSVPHTSPKNLELYSYERLHQRKFIFDVDSLKHQLATRRRTALVTANPISGTIFGYILYTVGFSLEIGGFSLYIEDVFVRENFRGFGLGKHLLLTVAKSCQRDGILLIQWDVLKWNESAIRFYERTFRFIRCLGEQQTGWLTYVMQKDDIEHLLEEK